MTSVVADDETSTGAQKGDNEGDVDQILGRHASDTTAKSDNAPSIGGGSDLSSLDPDCSDKPPVVAHKDRRAAVNTDGRNKGDWESHYCDDAKKKIRLEAWLVGIVFVATLGLIFLTWRGSTFSVMADGCGTCSHQTFNRYAYFYLGGQFGGIMFAVKYLYKVVSHGYWHLDRRLWRIFSPFLSGGLALAIGAMLDSGILGLTTKTNSGSGYLAVGFIAGYFADSALAKMQEVADTVFGATKRN